MYKLCVITTTRADYGLLTPLIRRINESEKFDLKLVVSGTHLMKEYGYTKKEIIEDGFPIDCELDWKLEDSSSASVSKSMGQIMLRFSEYIERTKPDMGIILGDRYEMLSFAAVFVNARIPIAHINGGETTEGALDECYRHCLTKMSNLHFPNNKLHRNRIIQMGEQPDKVFNVGDLSVENIRSIHYHSIDQLREYLKFDFDKETNIVVTYHPVTTEENSYLQLNDMLEAMDYFKEFTYVITKSNADEGGSEINSMLEEYAKGKNNVRLVDSLGMVRFLSLLNNSCMMLGNSSSGLYEAPLFNIPTVNIGNRQKGRLQPKSVINSEVDVGAIIRAMECGLSESFREVCRNQEQLFGDGTTSNQMVSIIEDYLKNNKSTAKEFWDKF